MSKFFNFYPKISYDINGNQLTNYSLSTNVLFRVGIIRSVLQNISAYYEHTISDEDTVEILAEKIYGEPEAHWVILLANNMIDGGYDWPLNNNDFNNYIINKYGSIQAAKTTPHHYNKVIERTESLSGTTTQTKFEVNQASLATVIGPDVPYDSYATLPETQQYDVFDLGDGRSVTQIIRREVVYCYDYENDLNESKRLIKIIKPEYYGQILREFNSLTKYVNTPFIRKLT